MVRTELKFERLIRELDELIEELQGVGGQINDLNDGNFGEFITSDEIPGRINELESQADELEYQIEDIAKELGFHPDSYEFDTMCNSTIVNRWEIYTKLKNAKIVNVFDKEKRK